MQLVIIQADLAKCFRVSGQRAKFGYYHFKNLNSLKFSEHFQMMPLMVLLSVLWCQRRRSKALQAKRVKPWSNGS